MTIAVENVRETDPSKPKDRHRALIGVIDEIIFSEREGSEPRVAEYFRRSKLHDQGTQGAIYKYTVHDLLETAENDSGVDDRLRGEDFNIEELDQNDPLRALKVLKVASHPKAAKEYEKQHRALEILESVPENERDNYARVPGITRPVQFRPDKEAMGRLAQHGVTPDLDGRVDVLPMDYVDGEDLYKILCKAVLEKKGGLSAEDLYDINDVAELEARVLIALGEAPMRAGADANNVFVNHLRIQGKLLRAAHSAGIKIPTEAVQKISRTLDLWRKEKFVHGDLHLRNVMFTGGYRAIREGLETAPVIIDFGGDGVAGEDASILNMLRVVNTGKDERDLPAAPPLRSLVARTVYNGNRKAAWAARRAKFNMTSNSAGLVSDLVGDVLAEKEEGAAFVLDLVDSGVVESSEAIRVFENALKEHSALLRLESERDKLSGPKKAAFNRNHLKELTELTKMPLPVAALIRDRLLPELKGEI